MRANTNIELKEKLQIELSDFKGVDFSSSPLRVQQNRASNMKNFINEYGVNKKRNGWNELFRIKNQDGSVAKINGIYQYVNNDYKMMLVHAGTRFYEVEYNTTTKKYISTDITESSTYAEADVDVSLLLDKRSQVFFNNSKAYITGCGDYLVYGSWDNGETYELRRVIDNEDTYVPTTTISIDNDAVTDGTRSSLDDINLLSTKRKNQLLGVDNASATWTVDSGEIDENTEVSLVLETLDNSTPVTKEISNSGADKTKLFHNSTEVGFVNFATGQITLSINTAPQIAGRDNITITFKHTISGYTDRIAKCNFGILFGVGGNTDRLFLSGNSDYPNIDFHSEMDDYTYFGDLNTSSMGSNSVAIMGYARLSDSTLVIYKEDTGQEASIFYRTGKYSEQYDDSGSLQSIRSVFPTTAGSIGEGVVSRFATCNFAGDNIILSKNGVFGIVLANNVATAERYTRERSRYINEKLKKHTDLSQAVGIVYKNRFYLSVDNVCYVADARFKSTAEGDMEDTFNYEWWYWDNIPARVWANIENNLYFGTATGQVCVFDNYYIDRTYQDTESGDLLIDVSENAITYNENIGATLAENDEIKVTTDGLYQLLIGELAKVEDNKVFVSESEIVPLYDGIEVYVDNVGSSGLSVNTKYILSGVDKGLCCFYLKNTNGDVMEISDDCFRICKHISQSRLYLTNVTDTTFGLKDYITSEQMKLASYNSTVPINPLASFVIKRNVIAEWFTPIFDFGTNQSSKTLLKMTISTEPTVNGAIVFGYETKSVEKNINAKGVNVFSFEDMNFENFSFDTGFASSYTIKVKERNFNFIMFRFYSDNEHDCAINTFAVLYKINKSNKGVQ